MTSKVEALQNAAEGEIMPFQLIADHWGAGNLTRKMLHLAALTQLYTDSIFRDDAEYTTLLGCTLSEVIPSANVSVAVILALWDWCLESLLFGRVSYVHWFKCVLVSIGILKSGIERQYSRLMFDSRQFLVGVQAVLKSTWVVDTENMAHIFCEKLFCIAIDKV